MSPRDLRLARTRGLALTPTRVRSAAPTCAGRIVQIGSCAVRPHAQLTTALSRFRGIGHSASSSPKSVEVGSYLFLSLHPSSIHFLATFVSKPRSTSRRHGSLDLGKERQMRSNVTERSSFCAHPMWRPHACAARNHADLYRTLWVLLRAPCAAPCACRAATARIARSR